MTDKKIFWLAGEKSGDLHASMVIHEFNKNYPPAEHYGVGGACMESAGFRVLFPFKRFSVMGFVEVIKHLRFFVQVEKDIKKIFQDNRPDLVVLIDYPGLNFRIGKLAHSFGIPVLYYISPQFWAWKYKRVYDLADFTSYVACILPFEEALLKKHGVTASFVGHPVAEELAVRFTRAEFAQENQLDVNKKWISFFPGSRDIEINKLLPEYLVAAELLLAKDYEIMFSLADSVDEARFMQKMKYTDKIKLIRHENYEMMQYADFVVAKSGTTSLETAFFGTPNIVVYITSNISYLIAKLIVKIKRIGLVNIIFDADVVPELIQGDARGKNIARVVLSYLESKDKYNTLKASLTSIGHVLGTKSASQEVAQTISQLLLNEEKV